MFKCQCGNKTNTIRYKNGKKVCNGCDANILSGQWERRIMQEKAKHAADILQPSDPHFKEVYGEGRNVK